MTDTIMSELVDGVARISYNRPDKHNALTDEMSRAFREAVAWATSDSKVRCILLRGEGASFSSGRDTSQLGSRPEGQADEEYIRIAQEGKRPLLDCSKPVVAALKGYCLGGAFETALLADLRIGSTDLQVSLPEVQLGLVPDTGGTQLLTDLVGPARAKLMIFTGRRIGAAEALAWGIVDQLVAVDEIDETAMSLAIEIAAAPPLAAAHAKHLVDARRAATLGATLRGELSAQVELFGSADHTEARAARRERRPPRFTGA